MPGARGNGMPQQRPPWLRRQTSNQHVPQARIRLTRRAARDLTWPSALQGGHRLQADLRPPVLVHAVTHPEALTYTAQLQDGAATLHQATARHGARLVQTRPRNGTGTASRPRSLLGERRTRPDPDGAPPEPRATETPTEQPAPLTPRERQQPLAAEHQPSLEAYLVHAVLLHPVLPAESLGVVCRRQNGDLLTLQGQDEGHAEAGAAQGHAQSRGDRRALGQGQLRVHQCSVHGRGRGRGVACCRARAGTGGRLTGRRPGGGRGQALQCALQQHSLPAAGPAGRPARLLSSGAGAV